MIIATPVKQDQYLFLGDVLSPEETEHARSILGTTYMLVYPPPIRFPLPRAG